MAAIVKESWEIDLMREAGHIVARGHALLRDMARAGVSTEDLDAAYEKHVRDSGATPTFKGYRGFPGSICASINEEVVHGIPSPNRVLKDGDIISIDCGATYKGYVGDAAFTMGIGKIPKPTRELLEATEASLMAAIDKVGPGARISEIGRTVQDHAESRGFSVVKSFVGHGIGAAMHEEPQVPNFVIPNFEFVLRPGHCIAIEPMLNAGTEDVKILADGWTVVTIDGRLSAHFEHTIAVTRKGREILTRIED